MVPQGPARGDGEPAVPRARPDARAPRDGQDGGNAEGGEGGGEAVEVRAVPPLLRSPRHLLAARHSDRDVQHIFVVLIKTIYRFINFALRYRLKTSTLGGLGS